MTDLLDRPRTARGHGHRAGGERPRVDPRIARRWVEARRQEGRRRLRILLWALSLAAVAALAVGSLYTPIFEVGTVRVSLTGAAGAAAPVSAARVRAEAGLDGHPLMIDLNAASAERRLDADPLLGAARVVKHWPGTVAVTVAERTALAQVAAGSGSGYLPVDATGRILGPATPAPAAGLPVLQGVGRVPATGGWIAGSAGPGADPAASPGAMVDLSAASSSSDVPPPAAAALAFLQALPAALRGSVQSVTTRSPSGISLTVAPPRAAAGTITVDLGDGSLLGAKVTAFETLLDQADLTGVSALDLSVPSRPAATRAGASSASTSGSSPTSGGSTSTAGTGSSSATTGSGSSGSGSSGPGGSGSGGSGSGSSGPGGSGSGSVAGTASASAGSSAAGAGSSAPGSSGSTASTGFVEPPGLTSPAGG